MFTVNKAESGSSLQQGIHPACLMLRQIDPVGQATKKIWTKEEP